eukprot:g17361.t1
MGLVAPRGVMLSPVRVATLMLSPFLRGHEFLALAAHDGSAPAPPPTATSYHGAPTTTWWGRLQNLINMGPAGLTAGSTQQTHRTPAADDSFDGDSGWALVGGDGNTTPEQPKLELPQEVGTKQLPMSGGDETSASRSTATPATAASRFSFGAASPAFSTNPGPSSTLDPDAVEEEEEEEPPAEVEEAELAEDFRALLDYGPAQPWEEAEPSNLRDLFAFEEEEPLTSMFDEDKADELFHAIFGPAGAEEEGQKLVDSMNRLSLATTSAAPDLHGDKKDVRFLPSSYANRGDLGQQLAEQEESGAAADSRPGIADLSRRLAERMALIDAESQTPESPPAGRTDTRFLPSVANNVAQLPISLPGSESAGSGGESATAAAEDAPGNTPPANAPPQSVQKGQEVGGKRRKIHPKSPVKEAAGLSALPEKEDSRAASRDALRDRKARDRQQSLHEKLERQRRIAEEKYKTRGSRTTHALRTRNPKSKEWRPKPVPRADSFDEEEERLLAGASVGEDEFLPPPGKNRDAYLEHLLRISRAGAATIPGAATTASTSSTAAPTSGSSADERPDPVSGKGLTQGAGISPKKGVSNRQPRGQPAEAAGENTSFESFLPTRPEDSYADFRAGGKDWLRERAQKSRDGRVFFNQEGRKVVLDQASRARWGQTRRKEDFGGRRWVPKEGRQKLYYAPRGSRGATARDTAVSATRNAYNYDRMEEEDIVADGAGGSF